MSTKHTKHGKLRTKQRVGVPGGVAAITIRNAWQYGIQVTALDNNSELYKWVISHKSPKTPNLRLHGQHLYLFSEDIKAVTVLNLPDEVLEEFTKIWSSKKKTMRPPKTKTAPAVKRSYGKPNAISLITGTRVEKLRINKASYNLLKSAGFSTLGDFLGRKNDFDSDVIKALALYGIVPDEKGIFRLSGKIV